MELTQTESDYSGVDGVVVLNMSKASFEGYGIRPFLQVGLVPSSDKTAILLGAGITAYDRFTFSLGAVYQRVNTLAPGLTVGQELASPDDVKVERHFKTGLFLMLGATTD